MRMLRGLIALVLVCGLASVAKAQAGDFQMVVIDPTYDGGYVINPITSTTFPFTFTECESPGQLPDGVSYDGCFTGQNETGSVLTGLLIDIPNIDGLNSQPVGCALNGGGLDLFSNVSCSLNADQTDYILDFTGGSIGIGQYFTLAEDGVDVTKTSFPPGTGTLSVPESRSAALLAVDVVMCVGFIAFWRRRVVRVSHF